VAAVNLWIFAGSREEPAGRAGLARLFERLMFNGSANVPAGGYAAVLTDAGGRITADVDEEAARFGESVPSNRLNLALWLEADRLRSLAINDSTVADARLGLVEDLGQRVNNEPYAAAIIDAVATLYDSATCLGYSHPTIGRVGSITSISTADARGFFQARYVPNNARLVVSGDFAPPDVKPLIAQYFSDIPRGSPVGSAACEPGFHSGARTRRISGQPGSRLAVGRFYRIPPHNHADVPALELLGVLLSQGNGSRLARALAREAHAAVGTQGGILGDRRGPEAFGLFAIAAEGVSTDSLDALLQAQAAWAASDSVTDRDLTRAKNIYRATLISRLERPVEIADQLQHAAAFHGALEDVTGELTRVMAVTLADLRRVAAAWLVGDNALTLVVAPEGAS
jgi:predicted Zn-dependent peptidase